MSVLTPHQIGLWQKDWPDYWVTNEGWNVKRQDVEDLMETLAHYKTHYDLQLEMMHELLKPPVTMTAKKKTLEWMKATIEGWK